ncbi:hypothetical protein BaRGS_00032838 [Batillaria attramentaria]|uniref:Uncharacterized protein n=1 Tax=Batillaria attramentaria TaxID=370345 RepID=A0ABD0JM92_9CAEN
MPSSKCNLYTPHVCPGSRASFTEARTCDILPRSRAVNFQKDQTQLPFTICIKRDNHPLGGGEEWRRKAMSTHTMKSQCLGVGFFYGWSALAHTLTKIILEFFSSGYVKLKDPPDLWC